MSLAELPRPSGVLEDDWKNRIASVSEYFFNMSHYHYFEISYTITLGNKYCMP
jgi:hypothetical protein